LGTGSVLRNKGRGNQGVAVERVAAITKSFFDRLRNPTPYAKSEINILHSAQNSVAQIVQNVQADVKNLSETRTRAKSRRQKLSETGSYWIWRRGHAMTVHF
jgi:hypothetical protein